MKYYIVPTSRAAEELVVIDLSDVLFALHIN